MVTMAEVGSLNVILNFEGVSEIDADDLVHWSSVTSESRACMEC